MAAAWDGSRMGWQPHVVSGGRWLLTFWLASIVLLQQFSLPHRLQGGAPLRTVLSGAFPGDGVDGKRFHGDLQTVFETFLFCSCRRRVLSAVGGLACELHCLPVVTETAPGWSGCWVGLLEQGPQCYLVGSYKFSDMLTCRYFFSLYDCL